MDFGTATTFDVISREGEYVGGVICPGINISAEALFQRAARLPRVDVRKPARAVGQTTVDAMQSGLFFGYVEMVDGLVRRIRSEIPGGDQAIVIATGGLAPVLSAETEAVQHVDAELTLDGLRLIWERNRDDVTEPGEYARQVERYLCQKNRGHLVRVVGPAFELVCGWADDGRAAEDRASRHRPLL